jgi:MbtH protein
MSHDSEDGSGAFVVLKNDEGQYSLWQERVAVPAGWSAVRKGTRDECCKFVNETWTDMRPLSLRKRLG